MINDNPENIQDSYLPVGNQNISENQAAASSFYSELEGM